ncbi:hypothetical protein ACHAXT_009700 [Thalassiosira profunda]
MVSAANRAAAKLAGGLGRNRPARGQQQQQPQPLRASNHSHSDAGGTAAAGSSSASSGGGPAFMPNVREQYESLSDKLARESSRGSSTGPTGSLSHSGGPSSSKGSQSTKEGRRVRWARTAALASTLDGAADADDDDPLLPRSPIEVLGDVFARKYAVPAFLLASVAIFLLVHLAGGPGGDDTEGGWRHRGKRDGDGDDATKKTGLFWGIKRSGGDDATKKTGLSWRNVGDGDGFDGAVVFSLSPSFEGTTSPTREAVSHTTPKIAPISGETPGTNNFDGNEPGWILVPTKTLGGLALESDGGGTTLKYGEGVPSPAPAGIDDGSKTTLKWNYGDGVPTPDPALLSKDDGSPTSLAWNYPPGVPTPDPALLVEVAPPGGGPDDGSPTTLKWGGLSQLSKPAPVASPDAGAPTTLKWNYPYGEPTPDPALLNAVPDTMVWGYPPGVPTPDPVLLAGGMPDTPQLTWGYPPNVPTPDPALLTSGGVPDVAPVGWGYPPGEPTPDPALLHAVGARTEPPSQRNVETGQQALLPNPNPKPTPPPTQRPTGEPVTYAPATVKVLTPKPAAPPKGPRGPDPVPRPPKPPLIDEDGNIIELDLTLLPPRVNRPRGPRPPGWIPPRRPISTPKVVYQPYYGPNWGNRPPNPSTVVNPGPGAYQGNGGVVIPMQAGGCGCCCCHCGFATGGLSPGGVLPYQTVAGGGFLLPMQAGGGALVAGSNAPTPTSMGARCPWDCVIDENVPTKGRSNEDDALYEIFYTNPLHCCGTIVEIGAGDGVAHSPSYFFEKGMNWTAILTEASPTDYAKLKENRSGKKATTVHGAYCKEGPELRFDDASGRFQSAAADDATSEPMGDATIISDAAPTVDCIRLDDVLAGIEHVNVMIVRVRGDPWAVLRTMNWDVQVDVWVILMEDGKGFNHDTLRAALRLHDYVPAAWDVRLWCDAPNDCLANEVWLKKDFNPIRRPGGALAAGSSTNSLVLSDTLPMATNNLRPMNGNNLRGDANR